MKIRSAFTAFIFAAAASWAHGQNFVSYQPADVVLGKSNFNTGSPTSATASNTNITADVAVDPTTGEVFVCDEANNRVLRFTSAAAATNGGAAEAAFGQPDLTTGTANTGGLSATSLSDPVGIYIDPNGVLWVADAGNNRVLRYDGATGPISTAVLTADQVIGQANFTTATSGITLSTVSGPRDIWLDTGGNLFVADSLNNRVLRFDAVVSAGNGPAATRVFGQANGTSNGAATTQGGLSNPTSLCIDSAGALWVADQSNNRVLRFAAAAGVAVDGPLAAEVLGQIDFVSALAAVTQTGLSAPRGVSVSSTGRLWVSDSGNNRVLWFDNAAAKVNGGLADGVLGQTNFTVSTAGVSSRQLDGPAGIFQDSSAHLWVADANNHRALRFTAPVVPGDLPPVITLTGKDKRGAPAASQHLRGHASDPDGTIVAVLGSVNGHRFTAAKGTTSWRYHAKKLRKGRNVVRLYAIDDAGLQSEMLRVVLIRSVRPAL